ncbi:MAG: NAD(P)/FAD-dependent oxidoreductase [Actinobacteria bacterium]|nr:NAD(P)/FAD-dependent oxidoreductase [Actinomycetota bacterium]
MVLVQLTGDLRWLRAPYTPTRSPGMGPNDTGGLAPEHQAEVRAAALEAILAWRQGAPPAIPDPDPDLLVRMLSVSMGEPVPPEYGPMMAAELRGGRGAPLAAPLGAVPEGMTALVIGAGISGLCAAKALGDAGIPFTIVEKHDQVGGTWLENRYPGAGVDTPSHLYSYSFAPHDWSRYFALQDELRGYLDAVADELALRPHIRFGTEVRCATWDDRAGIWRVEVDGPDGREELEARLLFSAVGIFNPPVIPRIAGLDDFAGPCFHTARWPADLDLRDRKVAVIGTGASAMQVVPEVADEVDELVVFQRSPQWAAPFEQFRTRIPEGERLLLREVPPYRLWYRLRLGWTFNDRVHESLVVDPAWTDPDRSLNAINDGHRRFFTRYIEDELGDRQDLLPDVLPDYPPFGKRMLMDNGWFRTVARDDVELVTEDIDHLDADGVVTVAGERHDVDVVVLATGFDVLRFLSSYEVRGRDGRRLREEWHDDDARAYLGLTVPGFPNLFTLYGPNTQAGHGGSLIFIVERQVAYALDLVRRMCAAGADVVEVRPEVHEAYNAEVDAAHGSMIWTHPGMATYYRNSRGRVVVNTPYRIVDLWHRTREADPADYRLGVAGG